MGRALRIGFLVVLLFFAAACGGREETREAGEEPTRGTEDSAGEAGTQTTVESADTGSETTSSGPVSAGEEQAQETVEETDVSEGRVLEDRYYQDSNGNAIPDFIEVEMGRDPEVDECALESDCPGVSGGLGESRLTDEQNTLLILDSSGSMAGQDATGVTKIEAAREALERYVVGTPDSFNLGLMVYGHEGSSDRSDREESCAGIETFAGLGELNVDNAPRTLEQFQPAGWTPIEGSLQAAAEEFAGQEEAANRVILVTDGIETCGGDPVEAARQLKQSGVAVTVDVVGFDLESDSDAQALRAVAEVTGGEYADAGNAAELNDYFVELLSRRIELTQALGCLNVESAEAKACVTGMSVNASSLHLGMLLRDEEDEERREAIQEIQDRIREYSEAYREQIDEATGPRIDELRRELDEARRRYEERYNEEISFSPCTEQPMMANGEVTRVPGSRPDAAGFVTCFAQSCPNATDAAV